MAASVPQGHRGGAEMGREPAQHNLEREACSLTSYNTTTLLKRGAETLGFGENCLTGRTALENAHFSPVSGGPTIAPWGKTSRGDRSRRRHYRLTWSLGSKLSSSFSVFIAISFVLLAGSVLLSSRSSFGVISGKPISLVSSLSSK